MSDDEKMAERLLKMQHMDVCYPTPHPLCVEAAALIRRRVAEKAKLVEAARPFAYLVEGDFYPTKYEVERLRAAIEEVNVSDWAMEKVREALSSAHPQENIYAAILTLKV